MNRIEISLEFIHTLESNVFQPKHFWKRFHEMKGCGDTYVNSKRICNIVDKNENINE